MNIKYWTLLVILPAMLMLGSCQTTGGGSSTRSDAAKIDRDVSSALTKLLEENQGARALAQKARGILVFPNMVIVNVGAAGALTTTTGQADIYAFFFNQKGLMGGISLQGSKISRINP